MYIKLSHSTSKRGFNDIHGSETAYMTDKEVGDELSKEINIHRNNDIIYVIGHFTTVVYIPIDKDVVATYHKSE